MRTAAALVTGGAVLLAAVGVGVAQASTGGNDGAPTDGATDRAADRAAVRVEAVSDALAGLVEDGTLTEEQADAVAEELAGAWGPGAWGSGGWHGDGPRGGPAGGRDGGPGGSTVGAPHGAGGVALGTVADLVGLSTEDLRDSLAEEGATLAGVAEQQGVSREDLLDALLAVARQHLADRVADGDLTAASAEEMSEHLAGRLEALVDREWAAGGTGHGPRGPGAWRSGAWGDGERGPRT